MKSILPVIRVIKQEFIRAFLFASFLALFLVAYAFATVSYPAASPSGEVSGGRFADVLNKMLSSNDYRSPGSGKAKDAAKLNGTDATGYQLRVTGSCGASLGIQSVATNGTVTCN